MFDVPSPYHEVKQFDDVFNRLDTIPESKQEFVRPRWPYDMRPSALKKVKDSPHQF